MSALTSLLRSELDRFADRYELTAREYDVMFLLLSGMSTVSLIAERLGLSQNTIHNHFKNVFRRTSTNSKAGLLALFLENAFGHQASLQPFIRRPSVLVVDPDSKTRESICLGLRSRGMRVEEEEDGARVLARIAELRTDIVIADVALPGQSGAGILTDVIQRFGKHPAVLLTTSDATASRRTWLELGALGLFVKPVSLDRISFAILEHCVDAPYERSRLLRVEAEVPVRLDDRLELQLGDIGFGGAFIPIPDDKMSRDTFLVGQQMQISFALEDSPAIQVPCEIIWRRHHTRPSVHAGVGVRFLDLNEAQRALVEEFVRKRKLSGPMPWTAQNAPTRPSKRAQA